MNMFYIVQNIWEGCWTTNTIFDLRLEQYVAKKEEFILSFCRSSMGKWGHQDNFRPVYFLLLLQEDSIRTKTVNQKQK